MFASSLDERAALVALLRLRPGGLSWTELTARVTEAGSALTVLHDSQSSQLFPSESEQTAAADAISDVKEWESEGLQFLTVLDDAYPHGVREIHQAPPFLFARGAVLPGDQGVSVVGSRGASDEGLKRTVSLAAALVDRGLTVVSGLAAGVDVTAHRTALQRGGRTVAVIGTGIRNSYPAANRAVQEEIAQRGLLLSQFWPDAPPQKHTFLMRNATMSGYGMATIVVEAGETSGARAQARMAVEHGRPVILTDMVVDATKWGMAMVGRPGVYVATSTDDAMAAVDEIRATPAAVDSVLTRLATVG